MYCKNVQKKLEFTELFEYGKNYQNNLFINKYLEYKSLFKFFSEMQLFLGDKTKWNRLSTTQ